MWHRVGLAVVLGLWGAQAEAGCAGRDLFAAMPAEEQAALRAKAEARPYSKGLVWRARKGEQEVILAGTYHLDDPRHANLLAVLTPALDSATALLVEAGPAEEERLAREMQSRAELMFDLNGPTLPELLTPEDWAQMQKALQARNMVPVLAAKFQPWYAAIYVSMSPCMLQEIAKGAEGLDKRLIHAAQARNLPIVALEPHDTIFTLFQERPAEEMRLLLRAALAGEGETDDIAATLAGLYFKGDLGLIAEVADQISRAEQGLSAAEVEAYLALTQAALLDRRNAAWVPVIEAQASKGGRVAVAAGALHMQGAQGVVNLLAQRGWQITPY